MRHHRPNPFYRRNAEERRRKLERAAATGDHEARARLFIEDLRAGKPVELIAAEILNTLDVRELQRILPEPLLNSVFFSLVKAHHTRPWKAKEGAMGGWFPDHELQNVCPRGHRVEVRGFDYTNVASSYRRVYEATDDTVIVSGLAETGDDDDGTWLACLECYAHWPDRNVEWE